jgi:alginate O-acetyltransferase complex protein AlgI
MLFNSWEFLVFLLVTMFLYYLPLFKKFQIAILIGASFIFYGWFQPWLLTLLLFSIFINAWTSFGVSMSPSHRLRMIWATAGVSANLAVLAFFKYSPLIASSIYGDWKNIDGIGAFIMGIPLPIGISFFNFQGISLVVDVFKEKEGTPNRLHIGSFQSHLFNTAFFKSFFPQLVSGPIVKAHDFYFQIREKYFSDIPWDHCARELILGYFLKCVVADNMKDQTFWIAYPYFVTMSSWDLVWMLFGYSVQIFADFAGYSLIALGIARLFGYQPVSLNFGGVGIFHCLLF